MLGPPADEAELLARAHRLAGRRLSEVAADIGGRAPTSLARAKGFVGELTEAALGAPRSSSPQPDFASIGVELKTLPLGVAGRPQESTYVCRVDPGALRSSTFGTSRLRKKLRRVLFVPVEAAKHIEVGDRCYGTAFLWTPSEDEELLLQHDWEDFADLAARGLLTSVSARRGEVLQLRPKAASAADRQTVTDADGDAFRDAPRGFYLRPAFTERVLAAAFA